MTNDQTLSADEARRRKFFEFLHEQQKRKDAIDEEVCKYLKLKECPTDPEAVKVINSRVGKKRGNLLRHHAYWEERKLRLGLESLYHAAHRAYIDICRHDAALGVLVKDRDFVKHVEQNVGYSAQKDVAAYCFLVSGIKDTLREIEKKRPDIADSIKAISEDFFSHNLTIFIRDLRNNLGHGSVTIPTWRISSREGNSYGSMTYDVQSLLGFGRWSSKSKKCVSKFCDEASLDATLNVSDIVKEHFDLMADFFRQIQDFFAENIADYEKDYFNIEDSHKKITRRMWAKILIMQVKEEGNPYSYLHKFFEPREVREILRKPNHSKEQVDYMISLKSVDLDFDEELRDSLYKIFGVPGDVPI